MTVTPLRPREAMKRDLLRKIAAANDAGMAPRKGQFAAGLPALTRAAHYKAIDDLIDRGLVENAATDRRGFALRITDAGRESL